MEKIPAQMTVVAISKTGRSLKNSSDELEDKKLKFEGWVGPKQALRLLKESERRFAKAVK
jgi:hypothetical protein